MGSLNTNRFNKKAPDTGGLKSAYLSQRKPYKNNAGVTKAQERQYLIFWLITINVYVTFQTDFTIRYTVLPSLIL